MSELEIKDVQQDNDNIDNNISAQVTSKLQEYCDIVTNYQSMVVGSSKELSIQIKEAYTVAADIDTKIQVVIIQLTSEINELRSEILFLRSIAKNIPEDIKAEVQAIIPKFSSEIQQIYQDKLRAVDNKIEENDASLIGIAIKATTSIEKLQEVSCNSLEALIIRSKKLDSNYFKQMVINIAIVAIVSTVVAISASYFIVRQFPTKVYVDNASNVTIDKSNVNILKKVEKGTK